MCLGKIEHAARVLFVLKRHTFFDGAGKRDTAALQLAVRLNCIHFYRVNKAYSQRVRSKETRNPVVHLLH